MYSITEINTDPIFQPPAFLLLEEKYNIEDQKEDDYWTDFLNEESSQLYETELKQFLQSLYDTKYISTKSAESTYIPSTLLNGSSHNYMTVDKFLNTIFVIYQAMEGTEIADPFWNILYKDDNGNHFKNLTAQRKGILRYAMDNFKQWHDIFMSHYEGVMEMY